MLLTFIFVYKIISYYRQRSYDRPNKLVIILCVLSLFFTIQIGVIVSYIILLYNNDNPNAQFFVFFIVIWVLLLSVYPFHSAWSLYVAFQSSIFLVKRIFFQIVSVVSVVLCLGAIAFCFVDYYYLSGINKKSNQVSNKDFHWTYLICLLCYALYNVIIVLICLYLKHTRLLWVIGARRDHVYPRLSLPEPVVPNNSQGNKWIIVNQMEWIPLLLHYHEKVHKQLIDFYNNEIKLESSSNIFCINYKKY